MSTIYEIAQRFDSYENQSLVDFFGVHIPCQILLVDTVGVERRRTPAMTEFILKSINAGLTNIKDVAGLLGLQLEFCTSLFHELQLGEYIGIDGFGTYSVWKRGKELLANGSEDSPIDRRLNIVWDPLCRKFLGRVPMYTKRRADSDGVIIPLAGAFAPPDLNEVGAPALRESQLSVAGGRGERASSFEVLRVTKIEKSIARYREALALVYKTDKGDVSLMMVTNGNIDAELTTACAQASIAKLIGVDGVFSSRHGGAGVRKRFSEIAKSQKNNVSLESLVRRRSLLRFKASALRVRLLETEQPELLARKEAAELDLTAVDGQLKNFPILPVRCHEVTNYVMSALQSARKSVLITTTMPTEVKLDFAMAGAFAECLSRGVQIDLYIADRPNTDGGAVLSRLDKLSRSGSFNVFFLASEARSVFEISFDEEDLCFFNEPPLGARRGPILPREFNGYSVRDHDLVSKYKTEYLTFGPGDLISRLRIPVKQASKTKPSQNKKNLRELRKTDAKGLKRS
jgi:hypothetical protein